MAPRNRPGMVSAKWFLYSVWMQLLGEMVRPCYYIEKLACCAQEEEAGKVKEAEGDAIGAIKLFLKGGLPGYAADCVNNHASYPFAVRLQL